MNEPRDWVDVWECDPPPDDRSFVVTEVEWVSSADPPQRIIRRIELVDDPLF